MKSSGTLEITKKSEISQVILALSRNINFRWGHGVKISDLLFRLAVSGLNSKKYFSFKHKRQSPVIGLYPLALASIFHLIS